MTVSKSNYSVAILMGGQAKRMGGAAKYALKTRDGRSILSMLLASFGDAPRIYLSVADELQIEKARALEDVQLDHRTVPVYDRYPGIGPLGGIASVMAKMLEDGAEKGDWLFVCACDMPRLEKAVTDALEAYLEDSYDCIVVMDRTGRVHPLCGFYRVSLLDTLTSMITAGDYRMQHLLKNCSCKIVASSDIDLSDSIFDNRNTPVDGM